MALVLLALVLGYLAYRLAVRPAPLPPPVTAVEQVAPPPRTYPVVVAARPIAAGERIDAAALEIERWPTLPAAALPAVDGLVGETARLDIAAGQPVTQALLVRGLARYLQPGERAVTIPVDDLSGVQNRVQPGDRVDLFYVVERGIEVAGTQTRLLQSAVKVLAYGMNSVDGPSASEDKPAAGQRGSPAARNAVLAVPVERVNELLLASRSGRLQMALRAPEDAAQPDPALFPPRLPVLAARPGLTPEQQARVRDPVNQAYAGEALPQLAGPAPVQEARPRPASPAGTGRSVEVVRGDAVQQVRY
ncbi:Flp pilus assembly protein CpaB [Bordetella sp. 2513F-2]